MDNFYDSVKKHVLMILRGQPIPQADEIQKHIDVVVRMMRDLNKTEDIDEAALFRDISSLVNTWQPEPSILRDKKHTRWLAERKGSISWGFWDRYRRYLEEVKNWPEETVKKLHITTDETLSDIGNPAQKGLWDRRGMIVGEVQSGKTANYTGLICKAVDAGYKLIIVLAGMTNDLRSQTQSRLDAEFLGFESEVGKIHDNGSRIGVGEFLDIQDQLIVHPLTYSSKGGDFRVNKSVNLKLGGTPLLLVVKKNNAVLERILYWAINQGKVPSIMGKTVKEIIPILKAAKDSPLLPTVDGVPLLLIDDEADNASVNTKDPDEDPTAINKTIRLILNAFQQRSYVGYTATPFANIFILPDEEDQSIYGCDLFPKNFIYYINPPDNYFGPKAFFGLSENDEDPPLEGMNLKRDANDATRIFPSSHKKDLKVIDLPETLIRSVYSFIISCAARRVRGQKDVHNSMLIHVTRYNDVQRQVHELVQDVLSDITRMIEYNTGKQAEELFNTLETIWNEDYAPTTVEIQSKYPQDKRLVSISWNDVHAELKNAVIKIQVRSINGDAGGVLDYDNNKKGLNVIAIGGDKLSRGLTLEGLSVSYYVRPSKNYDTLLQMGRWFGYRPGYIDLCRLYTTDVIIGWYEHIAVANHELQNEFNFMSLSHRTPEDYGLKVRTHPSGLNITATNKIKSGRKMRVSFSGYLEQTTVFYKEEEVYRKNLNSLIDWIELLPASKHVSKKGVRWEGIKPKEIISFLKSYENHPFCRRTDGELLGKYIEKMNQENELTDWTVILVSNSQASKEYDISNYKIGLLSRSDASPNEKEYMLKKSNILSPGDELLDLSSTEIDVALANNITAWERGEIRSKKRPERPSGPFIREIRSPKNGLLLIYPLSSPIPTTETPVIGFAVSFPKSPNAKEIEYQVNTRYWTDRYGEEE